MRPSYFLLPLALAGCSQVGRLRTDISAPPPALGPEVMALRNNLAIAFVERSVGHAGSTGCVPTSPGGAKCVMFRTDGTRVEIDSYLSSAFALTNSLCDSFFRTTNAAALHRQNTRANVNDVGTLVTAILGFAKAGSIATSAVASATGFGDSLLRNYDTAYLVTPDLATLQPLVRAEQAEVRKAIAASPPGSFQAAHDAVLLYAEPCSYLGMKRLLTRSVQLQTVVTQQGLAAAADAVVARAPIAPAVAPAAPVVAPVVPAAPAPIPAPAVPAVPVPAPAAAAIVGAGAQQAQVSALLAAASTPPTPPAVRWGAGNGRDAWTAAALDEVRNAGQPLWQDDFVPADVQAYCPGYAGRSAGDRQAFWVGLLSSMAVWETSGYNPTSVTRERDGTLSIGLLQLSTTDKGTCPWLDDKTIRQAEPNVRCGIRILARDVVRDGVVAQGTDKATARGAARYWGPLRNAKRGDIAAWTARQAYCRVV